MQEWQSRSRVRAAMARTAIAPDPKNPRLAGLAPDYLITAIDAYKDGSRKHDLMRNQVLALRDQDVKDLAAYYAAKEPQALAIRKPLTLGEWTARCNGATEKTGTAQTRDSLYLPARMKSILQKPWNSTMEVSGRANSCPPCHS